MDSFTSQWGKRATTCFRLIRSKPQLATLCLKLMLPFHLLLTVLHCQPVPLKAKAEHSQLPFGLQTLTRFSSEIFPFSKFLSSIVHSSQHQNRNTILVPYEVWPWPQVLPVLLFSARVWQYSIPVMKYILLSKPQVNLYPNSSNKPKEPQIFHISEIIR